MSECEPFFFHWKAVFRRVDSYLGEENSTHQSYLMERAMGIEPTSEAWEASILPLNYARFA